ncbi:MAG: pyridoxal-dependent aspartate 1-decarboxylase PanP [Vibrio sp.]
MTTNINKKATVSFESLLKIFTVPEGPDSTLTHIESALSHNLDAFLNDHIVAEEKPLADIERDFAQAQIPDEPEFVSVHTDHLLDKVVAHSVHTASPHFIGHMTSALPYFLLPLSKVMTALNQNLVKIETSKAFTPLERQVLGMLHHLIYQRSDDFYSPLMHSASHSLGAFCSGGTVANITALWVARNRALPANDSFSGIAKSGLTAALRHYGYDDLAIVVSERGHYSLKKAADVLGIGQNNLVTIPTDEHNRMDLVAFENTLEQLKQRNIRVFAAVGIAGTTETGNVDPLLAMANICHKENIHFHVDAAWGGATLFSHTYRHLLRGIEQADSVTIDAHKQLYIPMGAGMVLFKNPGALQAIEHHAQYILRAGSKDLGSHTLEGSRSGIAMLVYSSLHILGRRGYELLINQSIEKAHFFADLIAKQADFELVSKPELCLLTYRYIPKIASAALLIATHEQQKVINDLLNELTIFMQKRQRENGRSFVSRTQLTPQRWSYYPIVVFRVVLANPLTTQDILASVLDEQRTLATQATSLLKNIQTECQMILQIPNAPR